MLDVVRLHLHALLLQFVVQPAAQTRYSLIVQSKQTDEVRLHFRARILAAAGAACNKIAINLHSSTPTPTTSTVVGIDSRCVHVTENGERTAVSRPGRRRWRQPA